MQWTKVSKKNLHFPYHKTLLLKQNELICSFSFFSFRGTSPFCVVGNVFPIIASIQPDADIGWWSQFKVHTDILLTDPGSQRAVTNPCTNRGRRVLPSHQASRGHHCGTLHWKVIHTLRFDLSWSIYQLLLTTI